MTFKQLDGKMIPNGAPSTYQHLQFPAGASPEQLVKFWDDKVEDLISRLTAALQTKYSDFETSKDWYDQAGQQIFEVSKHDPNLQEYLVRMMTFFGNNAPVRSNVLWTINQIQEFRRSYEMQKTQALPAQERTSPQPVLRRVSDDYNQFFQTMPEQWNAQRQALQDAGFAVVSVQSDMRRHNPTDGALWQQAAKQVEDEIAASEQHDVTDEKKKRFTRDRYDVLYSQTHHQLDPAILQQALKARDLEVKKQKNKKYSPELLHRRQMFYYMKLKKKQDPTFSLESGYLAQEAFKAGYGLTNDDFPGILYKLSKPALAGKFMAAIKQAGYKPHLSKTRQAVFVSMPASNAVTRLSPKVFEPIHQIATQLGLEQITDVSKAFGRFPMQVVETLPNIMTTPEISPDVEGFADKLSNYYHAIKQGLEKARAKDRGVQHTSQIDPVVLDQWMNALFGGPQTVPSTPARYAFGVGIMEEIRKRYMAKTKQPITLSNVQAALWFYAKNVSDMLKLIKSKKMPGLTPRQIAKRSGMSLEEARAYYGIPVTPGFAALASTVDTPVAREFQNISGYDLQTVFRQNTAEASIPWVDPDMAQKLSPAQAEAVGDRVQAILLRKGDNNHVYSPILQSLGMDVHSVAVGPGGFGIGVPTYKPHKHKNDLSVADSFLAATAYTLGHTDVSKLYAVQIDPTLPPSELRVVQVAFSQPLSPDKVLQISKSLPNSDFVWEGDQMLKVVNLDASPKSNAKVFQENLRQVLDRASAAPYQMSPLRAQVIQHSLTRVKAQYQKSGQKKNFPDLQTYLKSGQYYLDVLASYGRSDIIPGLQQMKNEVNSVYSNQRIKRAAAPSVPALDSPTYCFLMVGFARSQQMAA